MSTEGDMKAKEAAREILKHDSENRRDIHGIMRELSEGKNIPFGMLVDATQKLAMENYVGILLRVQAAYREEKNRQAQDSLPNTDEVGTKNA